MLSAIYADKRHNEEGFTLLELLIVVIVIGILAAISLPIFLNQQKAAIDASVQSDVRNSVAELTGAQATKEATFKPTLSRDGTSLALVDTTNSAASKTVTEGDADVSLPTPADTDAYTLSGYNAGGGKFQGPSVADGKTFAYDGSTGKFSDGTVAATDPGEGSGGTTDPGTDPNPGDGGNGGTPVTYTQVSASTFEDGDATNAYFGDGYGDSAASAGIITSQDPHSGAKSAHIELDNFGGGYTTITYAPTDKVAYGKQYQVDVWVKFTSTDPGDFTSAAIFNTDYSRAIRASDSWQHIVTTWTPTAAKPNIRFYQSTDGSIDDEVVGLSIDDLTLSEAN